MNKTAERLATLSRSRLMLLALDLHERLEAQADSHDPIAVVGMACRFPGGVNDPDAYWQSLQEGRDAVREVPKDRWDIDAYYDPDPTANGKTYCRHGGFLNEVDQFDADFFGLSPREAISMDPQQRILLETAWEALEDAGQPADRLPGTPTGVFIGAGANDYSHLLTNPDQIDGYGLTGNALHALAGRISFVLGLRGPSLVVDTACSSSLVAVHLAATSLRTGESRMAIAGGVNLMLIPTPNVVVSRLRMLAPDGHCKAFDAAANGFVRGEGCGVVVLKRLEDARADGDRILAILRSSAVNQDGISSGFTVPNMVAQQALLKDALRKSGLTADQVSYVEAHGTGTSLGDPVEIQSLHEVLGQTGERPLYVGSVKANFGHLESAAGIAGFIKTVLVLQHRQIPRQIHFQQPTPLFDWAHSRIKVTPQTLPWPNPQRGVACISSFGVSGTNAHAILQEADSVAPAAFDAAKPELLLISARSRTALEALAARYADFLDRAPADRFPDFCLTANTGRAQLPVRTAITGTRPEVLEQLRSLATGGRNVADVQNRDIRIAGIFGGDVPQNLNPELLERLPAFRATLDRCSAALSQSDVTPKGIGSAQDLLFGSSDTVTQTPVAGHLKSFIASWAFAEQWRACGVLPASVYGTGIGEVAAACLAGCLSLTDAITLTVKRSELPPEKLAAWVQSLKSQPPTLGFIDSQTGRWLTRAPDADFWLRTRDKPAAPDAGLKQLQAQKHNLFLHFGPCTPDFAQAQDRMAETHLCGISRDGRSLLDALGHAFEAGCSLRMEALSDPENPGRKIAIPLYPFERQRYWLDQTIDQPKSASTPENLYRLDWVPQAVSTSTASDIAWRLDAVESEQRLESLFKINAEVSSAGSIFLAAPVTDDAARLLAECDRFLAFAQQAIAEQRRVVLVTRNALTVETPDVPDPVQASLWGMARVLMSEHPELNVTLLDLPAGMPDEKFVQRLRSELEQAVPQEQIAVRGPTRYVARLHSQASPNRSASASLRTDATYLVTGGKGGIGRHLLQWLADRGAGRIVVMSRQPGTAEFQQFCESQAARGCRIEVATGDVSLGDDASRVLAACGSELRGIFHLAGVLDDGTFAKQSQERLQRVLAPKAWGAWHLHQASRQIDLDHFVLFSSATAVLGTPGQANYAAANAFLDALSELRRSQGLPAQSLQWGPWAGDGMSRSAGDALEQRRQAIGVKTLEPAAALAVLEGVLSSPASAPQLVLAADWKQMQQHLHHPLPLLADLLPAFQKDKSFAEAVSQMPTDEARKFLRHEIAREAARILRLQQPIRESRGFFEAGMDSLMALELRSILQNRLGVDTVLPTSLLFDFPNSERLGEYLAELLGLDGTGRPRSEPMAARRTEPIAIVGMGCRYPGGVINPETYWEFLLRGCDAIREIPRERWDADAYYDPDPEAVGKMISRRGGFIDDVDRFDNGFFGIAPREALHLDPQQRLLLEVTWEALENAGIAADQLPDRSVGVFVGISNNDYLRRLDAELERGDAYLGVGNALSAAAGRLSYVMNWHGPSLAVDTACSSSLVSVHLASQALLDGGCSMAVAGGVNLVLSPVSNVQLTKSRMLAPDGLCKVFDAQADGYVRGEGCGMVVLKRLSDAVAAGDRIWAVIRGSAVNQDGRTAGLTVPNGASQVEVIQEALTVAGLQPQEVQYVEAHGTGTSLGDPIELNALSNAYAAGREDGHPLLVGSVKANLGHLESAAGIAGLMKSVLVLHYNCVPPQPHFHEPTPHFPWDQKPVRVATELHPLSTEAGVRRAAVSSFGFIGTNAHAILESPPTPVRADSGSLPCQILALSARTPAALERLRTDYARELEKGASLEDLCFTADTGRARFSHRLALVACDAVEAGRRLLLEDELLRGDADPDAKPIIALWFPGTGVSLATLESHPLWHWPVFQRAWRQFASTFQDAELQSADDRLIGFLFACTLGELWRSWGIVPAAVAGKPLFGEIAAGCFAGALGFTDALPRVQALIAGETTAGFPEQSASEGRIRWVRHVQTPEDAFADSDFHLIGLMDAAFPQNGHATAQPRRLAAWHPNEAAPILRTVGELFVAGVDINWSQLYSGQPRKITLPTYPFQRQRFWPDEVSAPLAPFTPSKPSEHPLLGQRFFSPAITDVVFEAHITRTDPPLVDDHRVYDKPILSGPAQISMVFDAAARIFPPGTYVVSDATFLQPNILTEPQGRTMQLILKPDGLAASCRIVSVPYGRERFEAEWILHSTGTVRFEPASEKHKDLKQLQQDHSGISRMSGSDFYSDLCQLGVTLGPTFRWIEHLDYQRGSSLGSMRPSHSEDRVFRIAPGLSDACFQTMAAATGVDRSYIEQGIASVPLMAGEVRMYRSCENASWCHAELTFDHADEERTIGGWTLFDDEGRVLVEARNLHLKRAPRESLFRSQVGQMSTQVTLNPVTQDWRPETIRERVVQQVLAVLGTADSQPPGPREKLFDLGLDSLMAVDLKQHLEADFGRAFPATLLFDYPTINALTQYLSTLLVVTEPAAEEPSFREAIGTETVPRQELGDVQLMSEEELNEFVMGELKSLLNGKP